MVMALVLRSDLLRRVANDAFGDAGSPSRPLSREVVKVVKMVKMVKMVEMGGSRP